MVYIYTSNNHLLLQLVKNPRSVILNEDQSTGNLIKILKMIKRKRIILIHSADSEYALAETSTQITSVNVTARTPPLTFLHK